MLCLVMALGSCALPGRVRPVPTANGTTGHADAEWDSGMISVSAPDHTFSIDAFEMAELAPGDYFAARNQTPVTNLSRETASGICHAAGKRLCTLEEWKFACLGLSRRSYSYGNAYSRNRCNVTDGAVHATGRRADCHSDLEVHDMVGNVMEWVEDLEGDRAVAAGGSFASGEHTDCFTTLYFPSDARNNQIGFRCCK